MIRNAAVWQILMGLFMCLTGMIGGCQLLAHGGGGEEVPTGPASTRRLREYGTGKQAPDSQGSASGLTVLVLGALGVGMAFHGVRQLRREGHLMVEGIPVVGRVTHVTPYRKGRGQFLTYRFEDDAGVMHEGTYDVSSGALLLDSYEVGQEVTVIYDPANPYNHVLDVENVRRAEAALRTI